MKRKFSLFFNIATLVLCVCAIAIGVYSAKTASLNIGGSVGFVAHNCKVELSGSIQACTSSEATVRTTKKITTTTIGEITDTYKLDLDKEFSGQATGGKMYFSDMFDDGKTVIVTLNIKNVSAFDITATANMPIITGAVITVVKLGDIAITESTSINLSVNATTTLEITITLNNTDDDLGTDVSIAGTLFNFAKYTAPQATGFAVQYGEIAGLTGDRTYVKMGKYDEQDLKWYIFAQGDGTTMESVSARVEDNGVLSAGTYWFISEYVLDCDTANEEYGIPFDADGSQIYNGSDIQTYINNVSESATTTDSFAKKYNFSADDNAVYSKILEQKGRDLPSEAKNGIVDAFTGVEDQYFWLLSVTELTYLAGEQVSAYNTYDSLIAKDATSSHTASLWWLRSPRAKDVYLAFNVDCTGGVLDCLVSINRGVRAAFQITIPA